MKSPIHTPKAVVGVVLAVASQLLGGAYHLYIGHTWAAVSIGMGGLIAGGLIVFGALNWEDFE